MTYFIFKCCRLSVQRYICILLLFLTASLFVERYCFAVMVYKTKTFNYILVLLVVFLNTVFLYLIAKIRQNKHMKRMHEIYDIDRAQTVNC